MIRMIESRHPLDDPDLRAIRRMELLERWASLDAESTRLSERLAGDRFLLFAPGMADKDEKEVVAYFQEAVRSFFYVGQQGPTETRKYPGAAGVDAETIKRVYAVNRAKAGFISVLDELREWVGHVPEGQSARQAELDRLLRRNGLDRLNYRQVQRHFHVLEETPRLVSFTRVRTTNIRRIDWQTAHDRLARLSDSPSRNIQDQLARLEEVPREEPLAEVVPIESQVRLNLSFGELGSTRKLHIKTNVPIFFPWSPGQHPPEMRSRIASPRKQKRRSDRRIEERPFLPAIRVHRYLDAGTARFEGGGR